MLKIFNIFAVAVWQNLQAHDQGKALVLGMSLTFKLPESQHL